MELNLVNQSVTICMYIIDEHKFKTHSVSVDMRAPLIKLVINIKCYNSMINVITAN